MKEHSYAIAWKPFGPPVQIGGSVLPSSVSGYYYVDDGVVGWDITIPFRFELQGDQLVPTEIGLEGTADHPVTAAAWRDVSFQLVVDRILQMSARAAPSTDERESMEETAGRRRMTAERLQEVATIVLENPDNPTRQVSRIMHMSYRSASRWVAEARRRGFLVEES